MILFPAVDLLAGRVVRLERGDRSRVTVYSDDPAAVAEQFRDAGAQWVHVVDLSSAFEEDGAARAANDAAIRAIASVPGLSLDVGGGVRSLERVETLLDLGVERVAMGTPLVKDRALARAAAAEYGPHLVADVAARDGVVRVNGWREGTDLRLADLLGELAEMGFEHVVYTDIARDGMQAGVDGAAYRAASRAAGFPVVASGGVSTIEDVRALAALGPAVIEGVITGRALYEGTLDLRAALAVLGGTPVPDAFVPASGTPVSDASVPGKEQPC